MEELTFIIIGFLIIFIAAVVQGTTGFGFALTSMPLLGILIPLHTVIPIMIIFGILANILILIKVWKDIVFKEIWLLILSSIVAAPLGTYLLLVVEEQILKIVIGAIIVLFAFALWKGYSLKIKNEQLALVPVGFSSGLLNGSVSLMGPPVVLFLTNQGKDKAVFRANITAYAFILNIATMISFFTGGLIDQEVLTYVAWLFPALIIGTYIGIRIGNRVNQELFRTITLILIILSGISAILTSV